MEDGKKHLYVKFKMDSKLKIMEQMIISESRSTVDDWKAEEANIVEPESDDKDDDLEYFQKVAKDFESSINKFEQTASFIMFHLPLTLSIVDDRTLRQFISKHGERLESGDFELYSVDLSHISLLIQRLKASNAVASGVNAIPGLFIIGLVSAYDVFLSNLIRCIFLVRPELLSSSERNISFKDLIEIGSVEAARERIIEKAVESVLRDSHSQQIDWLEKALDIPLRKDLKIWPDFIELCERRNLLSHTDGVVSTQYLAVCKQHGVDIAEAVLGNRLEITAKYYEKAVYVMLEFGIKLTQVIWRKLSPEEIKKADVELNEISYRLILRRRHDEASTLLRFGLFEMKKHGDEATRKRMIVNLANAEKLRGNNDEAEKILSSEDWSAVTDGFLVCVAAVRDDVQTVIRLMKPAVAAGHLKIDNFQDWPVFEKVRSDPAFVEPFEREFNRRIVEDLEARTPGKTRTEAEEEAKPDSQVRPNDNTVH
jgi:hypothetical protein